MFQLFIFIVLLIFILKYKVQEFSWSGLTYQILFILDLTILTDLFLMTTHDPKTCFLK